jgi:SAM-dependent methyltransferase
MNAVAMERVACALCGSEEERLLFVTQDSRFAETPRQAFRLVACRVCGLRYVNPRPTEEALAAFYPEAYYRPRLRSREEILGDLHPRGLLRRLRPRRAARILREKLRRIARVTPPGGFVVEVGPGGGELLVTLEAAGFRVLGLDRPGPGLEALAEALGLAVGPVDRAEALLGGRHADTVVLWNTLEHLPDPLGMLRRAWDWLRPGGFLLLSVPNALAWERRWLFPADPCEDIPRHLYSFTPPVLHRLLHEAGFDEIRMDQRTLCSASELQFRTEARLLAPGPGRALRRVLYLGLVLPGIWALDRVLAAVGRAHTVVAQARKPVRDGT